MANSDLLQKRKTDILTRIAALDSSPGVSSGGAGSKPNITGDGVQVDHEKYKAGLYDELDRINRLLAAETGPWTVETAGET